MPTMAVDWRALRKELRVRRAELQMSVKDACKKAGIGRTTLYRLENVSGIKDNRMTLATVDALASALGLTLGQLFSKIETAAPAAPEIGEAEREFLKLPADVRQAAIVIASAARPHLPASGQAGEPSHASTREANTKSESGRRR